VYLRKQSCFRELFENEAVFQERGSFFKKSRQLFRMALLGFHNYDILIRRKFGGKGQK